MRTILTTWSLALAAALLAGCAKKDNPITGSASAPPVNLQCVWKPGYTYQVRLEMDQTTDIDPPPDPNASTVHRVTFEQVCLITVTNAPAGQFRLDLEVVSLGMERSKSTLVSTGFDSEQGGETFDDSGYVPVLRKLVGGKLRFLLSPDGRVVKADGISEWLDCALGTSNSSSSSRPPRRPPSTNNIRIVTSVTNADGSVRTTTSFVRATNPPVGPTPPLDTPAPPPTVTVVPPAPGVVVSTGPALGKGVASALRGFFTQDLFKQILEFNFLPTAPVRVGDQWQAAGDTPITGRGRPRYNAKVKFTGWQRHLGTNCVRLDVNGTLAQRAANKARDGTLTGTLWIDLEAQFPAAAVLDKDAAFPSSSTSRSPDTNEVANAAAPKRVHQTVGIRLLSIKPTGEAAANLAAP